MNSTAKEQDCNAKNGDVDDFLDLSYGFILLVLQSILKRAQASQRDLYPLFVVPMDVFVQPGYEVIGRDSFPVSPVEHLVLQSSEETLACRVVWRASLLGHRSCQVVPLHQLYPAGPTIMAASVGVDYRIA